MKLRGLPLGREAMTNIDSILKCRDTTLSTKVHLVKAMVFPVVTYGCESWTIRKAEHQRCFWSVVLEKTLESPLACKKIKPVNPKGNQSWIFIEKTDAKFPLLWPPDAKSCLIGKDPDAGKDWRQKEKGMTEDEMVGWHHPPDGQEFEQAPGDDEGQGSLVCCSPWGCQRPDITEQWTVLILICLSVDRCLSCFHIFKIFIVLFGCSGSQLQHMTSSLLFTGSLVASYRLFSCCIQAF